MSRIFLVFLLVLFSAGTIICQESKSEPEKKLKQYFMVFLKKGPVRDQDSLTVQKIQEGHMAHIREMADTKKLVMAGPFGDDSDIRGIFVFDVATLQEAKELTESDPAVKAGRLIMEIHPWLSMPGACLP